jgi:hypothetical protein
MKKRGPEEDILTEPCKDHCEVSSSGEEEQSSKKSMIKMMRVGNTEPTVENDHTTIAMSRRGDVITHEFKETIEENNNILTLGETNIRRFNNALIMHIVLLKHSHQ